MTTHKRKKDTRQRGYTTHGWGSMKKHRGAGHRGGRGMAGSGKRGDQNKPSTWKNKKQFGKFGFVSRSSAIKVKPISIKTLDDRADSLVQKGYAKLDGGAFVLDLADIGYNKLLSTGKATHKFRITTLFATEKAVDKIKKAGGDVTVLESKAKPKPKPSEEADESDAEGEPDSQEPAE